MMTGDFAGRSGLSWNHSPSSRFVGEVVNGLDAIEKARTLWPDLILMEFFAARYERDSSLFDFDGPAVRRSNCPYPHTVVP